MKNISFFLTPHQRHDAGGEVPKYPFQLRARSKTREAVEVVESFVGLHRPVPYSLQPESVKFLKNLCRREIVKNDPH